MEIKLEYHQFVEFSNDLHSVGTKKFAFGSKKVMYALGERLVMRARRRMNTRNASGYFPPNNVIQGIRVMATHAVPWPFRAYMTYGLDEAKAGMGVYTEVGRMAGAKEPPVSAIMAWLVKKSRPISVTNTGKRRRNLNDASTLKYVARLIARKIARDGITPKHALQQNYIRGGGMNPPPNFHPEDFMDIEQTMNDLCALIKEEFMESPSL